MAPVILASIAILIAVLAFGFSIYVFKRQGKVEENYRTIRDEMDMSDLATQSKRAVSAVRADIGITYNSSTQRIVIRNNGGAEAREVDLQLHLEETENPIPNRELVEKLPAPLLFPGDYIELMCPRFFGIPNPIRTTITWIDPDNLRRRIERPVYLS